MTTLSSSDRRDEHVEPLDLAEAPASDSVGRLVVPLLAGLLVSLALLYLWLHMTTPFDNGRLEPGSDAVTAEGIIVSPVPGGPAGLLAGDLITAVDGRSLGALTGAALRTPQLRPGWDQGDTVRYQVVREGEIEEVEVILGSYPLGSIVRSNWGTILFALFYLAIAAYVFWRRPQQRAPQLMLLAAAALTCSTTWSLGTQTSDFVAGAGLWLFFLTIVCGFMLVWIVTFHFALVFPRPIPVLARSRWLLPLLYGVPYLLLAVYLLINARGAMNALDWVSSWGRPADVTASVFLLLTLVAIAYQYRSTDSDVTRRQMRWLVLAALVVGGTALFFYFLPPLLGVPALDANLIGMLGVLFPLAVAIAILRQNLFDIDTLLNRALVYGVLTAIVLLLYTILVGAMSVLFQTQSNWLFALLATGIVAILFQPLREHLQKWINRLMYGQRDEPFEVLAGLGQRLEDTLSPEMALPTVVETVAQTLKLPYAAIALPDEEGLQPVVSYGKPVSDPVAFPLIHQGETVGQLWVAPRSPGEKFNDADDRLLQNIARQAGTAVYAVQLTHDLQESRRRLVTAREEERRRLRRDLHDGLGPSLAALHLQSGVLRRLIRTDPETAEQLVDEFRNDIRTTIDDIRRVAYELRPPALDELGLAAAVRSQAERWKTANGEEPAAKEQGDGATPLQVAVEAPETLPPLPAAVEVAAYRIIQEALANVANHARAGRCQVRMYLESGKTPRGNEGQGRQPNSLLVVEIIDDGVGLDDRRRSGIGLLSMRERAQELGGECIVETQPGGGTRVRAELPVS